MKLIRSLILAFFVLPLVLADLRVGFYKTTCPQAESIVLKAVQKRFSNDSSITAALLRMHFHDCFVRGCDASILIDSTKSTPSEKSAGANLNVRGYDLIDQVKKALEAACPSTISCADIIALATRDSVVLAGGPQYAATTGRRDGLRSNPGDVNLPGPSLSVSQALQAFTAKGMTLNDMVTLLGAHTVGFAHCSFFTDRLSNFQDTGAADPSMDPKLVAKLSKLCRKGNDPRVFLDQNTSSTFDNEFYHQLHLKRGVLQIDQELAADKLTAGIVSGFEANGARFSQSFGTAMIKMGGIEVLVGNAGQIRKNCRVFNPSKSKN